MPLLSPEMTKNITAVAITTAPNCWPIETLIAVSPTTDGLRVVEEFLNHLSDDLAGQVIESQYLHTHHSFFLQELYGIVHFFLRMIDCSEPFTPSLPKASYLSISQVDDAAVR